MRCNNSAVLRPALEAVDLARVDQELAHLQSCLQTLEALVTSRTTSFEGHPSARERTAGAKSSVLREHEALLGNVDFGHHQQRGLSSDPL